MSRIIALIASVIQLPWMIFVLLMAWGDAWHLSSGSGSTHQDSMLYLVAAFAPAGVGIPCGIYSTWVAGFGKRNIGGSLAISIFCLMLLYFLVRVAQG